MAAAEPSVAALAGGGVGAGAPSGGVPVLFCFSVFARPASVPHGAGYDVLIQKFLSLYGDQLDMHRKFVVQLFAEEWGQYVDLPKGFAVSERCKLRLVPLQIQVGPAPRRAESPHAEPGHPSLLGPPTPPRVWSPVPRAFVPQPPAWSRGHPCSYFHGRCRSWAVLALGLVPGVVVTSCRNANFTVVALFFRFGDSRGAYLGRELQQPLK